MDTHSKLHTEKKKKNWNRRRAHIRRLWQLHLEAILLLWCGQVRCTKLNSTTTMAKRATETKECYSCFLTPSLLQDQLPGALSKQHRVFAKEASGVTAIALSMNFMITTRSIRAEFSFWDSIKGAHTNLMGMYQCANKFGNWVWPGGNPLCL